MQDFINRVLAVAGLIVAGVMIYAVGWKLNAINGEAASVAVDSPHAYGFAWVTGNWVWIAFIAFIIVILVVLFYVWDHSR